MGGGVVEAELLMRRLSNDAPVFKILSFPMGWGAFLQASRARELHSPSLAVPAPTGLRPHVAATRQLLTLLLSSDHCPARARRLWGLGAPPWPPSPPSGRGDHWQQHEGAGPQHPWEALEPRLPAHFLPLLPELHSGGSLPERSPWLHLAHSRGVSLPQLVTLLAGQA